MERVLYNLHEKSCSQLWLRTSTQTRSVIESISLTLAVISVCTVLLFHRSYVFNGHGSIPRLCLQGVVNIQPLHSVDVTHVAISSSVHNTQQPTNVSISWLNFHDKGNTWLTRRGDSCHETICNVAGSNTTTTSTQQHSCPVHNLSKLDESLSLSFSSYEGYLALPNAILRQLNITMQYIIISKADTNCFGNDNKVLQDTLDYLFTPTATEEVIALNWVLGYHHHHSNINDNHHNHMMMKGYVKKYKTNQIIDLSTFSREFRSSVLLHLPFLSTRVSTSSSSSSSSYSPSWSTTTHTTSNNPILFDSYMKKDLFFKFGVLISSLFLFFVTTTIVSFTLRTTQSRMLHFTIQLQKLIRQRQHFSQLIIIHCVETMVFVPIILGIFFFLNDCFYNDKVLSFTILSGVWVCEIFSAIFMRTIPSSIYFPQVFFAYFTLFHVYYFSCPFGFTYAALFSITLLMVHSMIFFVNRFELPALATGQVSRRVPRMALFRYQSSQSSMTHETRQPTRHNHRGSMENDNTTAINGVTIRRSSSTHRMANGMSYPSMSSLGRITTSDGFDDSDDL